MLGAILVHTHKLQKLAVTSILRLVVPDASSIIPIHLTRPVYRTTDRKLYGELVS